MFFKKILYSLFLFFILSANAQVPPEYRVTICNQQSKGYYFLNALSQASTSSVAPSYNLLLNSQGDLIYFKRFSAALKTTDFKIQSNGLISYFSNNKFYLMDNTFTIVDSVYCKNNVDTDNHDLQILKNGHYLILGTEKITRNLSKRKIFYPNHCAGSPNTLITCGVIQELDKEKNVVFEWRSKDYFKFMDIDTFFIYGPKSVDWNHFNSIELDSDGNLLVSSRNFNEITKINRKDSSIIWRLGGKNNQFLFKNDSAQFKGQHDVRRSSRGFITLYDNGRETPMHPSSAKEYLIDEKNHVATLTWKYSNDINDHSERGLGNVQKQSNANTVICFGRSNTSPVIFTVFDPKGNKCFELEFLDTLKSYRVFNYSNFKCGLTKPLIKEVTKNKLHFLEAEGGNGHYLWSTGETTTTIKIEKTGSYFVSCPTNDGGYIVSKPYVIKPKTKK